MSRDYSLPLLGGALSSHMEGMMVAHACGSSDKLDQHCRTRVASYAYATREGLRRSDGLDYLCVLNDIVPVGSLQNRQGENAVVYCALV